MLSHKDQKSAEISSANSQPKKYDEELNQPLFEAVNAENTKLVEILINAGANPNVGMCLAAAKGKVAMLTLLLKYGADPNTQLNPTFPKKYYLNSSRRPITHATFNGHLGAVKLLINSGADVSHNDIDCGGTLLSYARGHTDIIKYLLPICGAHEFTRGGIKLKDVDTILDYLDLDTKSDAEALDLAKLLIAAGAKITDNYLLKCVFDKGWLSYTAYLVKQVDAKTVDSLFTPEEREIIKAVSELPPSFPLASFMQFFSKKVNEKDKTQANCHPEARSLR